MGNSTSQTLEASLPRLTFEHLEPLFNASTTGKDQDDPTIRLMTKNDFKLQFPYLSQQKLFGQSYFNLFDVEGLDSIDFSSFFGGLSILVNNKLDTKLDAIFRLLDPAGNGVLQEYELLGFVEKTLQVIQSIDPTVNWNEPFTIELTQTQLTHKLYELNLNNERNSNNGRLSLQNASTSTITPMDIDISFQTIPISFGPLEICWGSAKLVQQGLQALGKTTQTAPTPTISTPIDKNNISTISNTSSLSTTSNMNDNGIVQSVSKREFAQFIQSSPQLLFSVVWLLNLSLVQHICNQTRVEFVQQCEAQLAINFPMSENQLFEQYTKIATFFYEVLLRRLTAVDTIKDGSLLQKDLITLQQHFNNSTTIPPDSTKSTSSQPPTPSARTSSSRFSFSRHSDVDTTSTPLQNISESTTLPINTNASTLFPKLTPINFPSTYAIPDTTIQLTSMSTAPIITPLPTPKLQSTPSMSNSILSNSISHPTQTNGRISRPSSATRESSSMLNTSMNMSSSNININPSLLTPIKAPFDIPDIDIYKTQWTPHEFAKQCHPDSIQFTLLFLKQFKLQALLHRNRIASKALCAELIEQVQMNLNMNYVDLITNQYVYETQTQYTIKNKHSGYANSGCDINQTLQATLEARKKQHSPQNHGKTIATNNNNVSGKTDDRSLITTKSSMSSQQQSKSIRPNSKSKSPQQSTKTTSQSSKTTSQLSKTNKPAFDDTDTDDDDDLEELGDIDDILGMKSTKTNTTNNKKSNNIDDTIDNHSSSTKNRSSINNNSISQKVQTNTSQNRKSTSKMISLDSTDDDDEDEDEDDEISEEAVDLDDVQYESHQQMLNDDDDVPTLINPGNEYLMTEAIIPNFLQHATKSIHDGYIPVARGPYALPFLTFFLRTYIPDALGQLLAAYRHVLSRKVKTQTLQETQILLTDVQDYLNELLQYKQTVQEQYQQSQCTINELEDNIANYKSQHDDLANELLLTKEQNLILKTELTDVISVKDMAIITLRDELQFFTKESQHWSDQISKLNQQVAQLKQEKIQKDVEVAQLRAQKEAGCCTIM